MYTTLWRPGFGSQAQSHALLKQLLRLLRMGNKREAVRGPLLDALLSYLQACRGPRIAHASADLFQAAISGTTSARQLMHNVKIAAGSVLPPSAVTVCAGCSMHDTHL